jgi:hypothetical protein
MSARRRPVEPPRDLDPAVVRLIEALAREAARRDHEREISGGERRNP